MGVELLRTSPTTQRTPGAGPYWCSGDCRGRTSDRRWAQPGWAAGALRVRLWLGEARMLRDRSRRRRPDVHMMCGILGNTQRDRWTGPGQCATVKPVGVMQQQRSLRGHVRSTESRVRRSLSLSPRNPPRKPRVSASRGPSCAAPYVVGWVGPRGGSRGVAYIASGITSLWMARVRSGRPMCAQIRSER